ncbi:hypothetical protein CHS0354_015084 [Potamilus streckersoni]|uniref:DRBM domain-containing protein n=1 Tax=Potamilus streckersoni TaxID=2493646 RepID=A0AAE0TGC1_9BIVA|nr:hypothetical protein CHS0354_015084 [Potamilus streckersoni]
MPRHLKRKLSKDEIVPFIKKKRRKRGVATPNNALMQLYDIKRLVQFKCVSRTELIFTMSVEVNGQTFIGKGPSKKKARLNAAEQAPKDRQLQNVDLTAKSVVDELFSDLQKCPDERRLNARDAKITKSDAADCENHGCSKPQISDAANVPLSMVKQTTNQSKVPKNALNQLLQMKRYVRFQFVSQSEPMFTMSLEVNGQTFVGKGTSKKKAKLDAAEQAFRSFVQLPNSEEAHPLIGRQKPNVASTSNFEEPKADVLSNNLQTVRDEKQIDVSGVQNELYEDTSEVPKILVDLVSRLVDEKISLIGGFKSQNTVLAGIKARGYDVDSISHICVSEDDQLDRPNGAEGKKDDMQGQLSKK